MESDKELLDKAAKAAGIEIRGPATKFIASGVTDLDLVIRNDRGGDSVWNPLTDDGDALRLAVKLDMFWENLELFDMYFDSHSEDKNEAMRRAIVLAAAEIGKSL